MSPQFLKPTQVLEPTQPLRIAFGRIAQETNALSPVLTTMADFTAAHYMEGKALLAACGPFATEAPGFMRNAELSGFVKAMREPGDRAVELVPLLSAWAVPSGPLSLECFETLRDRLCEGLRQAGPLDGVFLSMHGAMGVQGVRDPETQLLQAVREVVGRTPVAISLDLHANLTQARVKAADLLVAYRTNPHRDHFDTGKRAGRLLLRQIKGELHPRTAWRSLPMILGGGTTLDFWPPMRGIFQRAAAMEREPHVLSVSICMCHPWNDDPELGWSTLVTTDGDPGLAERLADELAERCWKVRHAKPPHFPSALEALQQAHEARLARRLGVVVLADASDVVSAGGTGENTRLLEAILNQGKGLRCLVPLRDPTVAAELWRRTPGETVTVDLGGKLDPARNGSLQVTATLQSTHELPCFGRVVVLAVAETHIVVTEGPALAIKPGFYRQVGLEPWRADVVVVKNFFPFRLFFLGMARKTLYVRTEGITDLDAAFQLAFAGPVHPRDPVDDWREADRRRRGVVA